MTSLTPEEIIATPAGDLADLSSTELFDLRNRASEIVSAAKKLDEHLDRALALKTKARPTSSGSLGARTPASSTSTTARCE